MEVKRSNQAVELDLNLLLQEKKTNTCPGLAIKYGVSRRTINKYLRIAREAQATPKVASVISSNTKKSVEAEPDRAAQLLENDPVFDEFYTQFRASMGWTKDIPSRAGSKAISSELTVIAGDTHAPFQHDKAIQYMLDRTAGKAKRLILAGDLADMFNMSKYAKFKRHYTPLEEIVRVQSLLALFSEAYEEVVLMRGNHDDRFIKYMQRMGLPAEMFEVFDYLHGQYSLHPIYVLSRGLKNVKVVEPIKLDYAEFAYLHQQGDCVISHAEMYSRVPNKSVGGVIHSLKSFHEPAGVVQPFKVVVQAHTHQAGKTFNDFGVVGIENGCLCMLPDYSGGAKHLPARAPVLGFTELYQENGVSDLERTNFIPFRG